METERARHISYGTRGHRVAGYVCLGLGGACVLAVLAASWILPGAKPGMVAALRVAAALVAAVFLFVGLVLSFKDVEVVIDRSGGVLGIGWSWLRWRRMTLYPLEADAEIHLDAVAVNAGQSTTTHYPVSYVLGQGAAVIVRGADYQLSRRRAEVLAGSLGLPLVDTTSGSRVVRGPEDLDRSAADPATLPAGLAWPRLPEGARLRARYEQGSLSVSIPPPGFGGITGFALLLLGFGGVLAWLLVTLTLSQLHSALVVVLGLLLLGLAALLAYAGYQGLADTLWRTRRLVVSADGIRMPRREGDGGGEFVAAAAIEEIDLTGGEQGVMARTDATDVELGAYLPPAEARWLRDMVHLVLAGRGPQGS